jgi:hypothetical protein
VIYRILEVTKGEHTYYRVQWKRWWELFFWNEAGRDEGTAGFFPTQYLSLDDAKGALRAVKNTHVCEKVKVLFKEED